MDVRIAQQLWAAAGWYSSGLDGIIGAGSMRAMDKAYAALGHRYTFTPSGASVSRKTVAAAQAALLVLGEDPGVIDGYEGHNTREALSAWLFLRNGGRREAVSRVPDTGVRAGDFRDSIPHQRDVVSYYGQPGTAALEAQLVTIVLPFEFRIDWNLRQRTSKIRVHRKAATQLQTALVTVHSHYGEAEWRRLGLDRYAGAYNPRRMRGGTQWSMHAYGCAIDFYAQPNGLRTKCPQALFCGSEYKDFLDIMEANEWLPAIRLWGKDAMHFQRARI